MDKKLDELQTKNMDHKRRMDTFHTDLLSSNLVEASQMLRKYPHMTRKTYRDRAQRSLSLQKSLTKEQAEESHMFRINKPKSQIDEVVQGPNSLSLFDKIKRQQGSSLARSVK